jgi:hypothetical protein
MTELDKAALEAACKALYAAWSDGDYDEALGLAAVAIRAYLDAAQVDSFVEIVGDYDVACGVVIENNSFIRIGNARDDDDQSPLPSPPKEG